MRIPSSRRLASNLILALALGTAGVASAAYADSQTAIDEIRLPQPIIAPGDGN